MTDNPCRFSVIVTIQYCFPAINVIVTGAIKCVYVIKLVREALYIVSRSLDFHYSSGTC